MLPSTCPWSTANAVAGGERVIRPCCISEGDSHATRRLLLSEVAVSRQVLLWRPLLPRSLQLGRTVPPPASFLRSCRVPRTPCCARELPSSGSAAKKILVLEHTPAQSASLPRRDGEQKSTMAWTWRFSHAWSAAMGTVAPQPAESARRAVVRASFKRNMRASASPDDRVPAADCL